MSNAPKHSEDVQITIKDSQISAGRDASITGVQSKIEIGHVSDGGVVSTGDNNTITLSDQGLSDLLAQLAQWQSQMEAKIDALANLRDDDKQDLKDTVAKIKVEAEKAEKADPGRLERLLNSIAAMGPDIFEVAVTTLVSPLAGIGLVLKKISDKAKLERQAQNA